MWREPSTPKREVIACHPLMGPVIGIAEAAMHAASFIATGFSIVTTLARTCVIARHLVETYGMARHCRTIRATELPVLALEDVPQVANQTIPTTCQRALVEDGSGAIILGCAGMTDLADAIRQEVGVPVIDGVGATVKFVEALVGLGLQTSKVGDLAYPLRSRTPEHWRPMRLRPSNHNGERCSPPRGGNGARGDTSA